METELRRSGRKKKEKKGLKALNIITTILVVIIVIIAVMLVGVRLIGFTPYTVLSGSMEPTYHVGSLIYVKDMEPEEIKVGDPITFILNEDLTVATHRVIEIDNYNQLFYTKGDANNAADGTPVNFKNLIGKPTFTIPYLGYAAEFLSTQLGRITGIAVLGLLIILVFVIDIKKKIKKNKQ